MMIQSVDEPELKTRTLLAVLLALLALVACQTTPQSSTPAAAQDNSLASSPAQPRVHVTGIDDWQGDIVGTPARDSVFKNVQIGMSQRAVVARIGDATDQNAYPTGKAWVFMYFGHDAYRHELIYRGFGRLVFASRSATEMADGHLIMIIHDAADSGPP
jgi:hypothetical protein